MLRIACALIAAVAAFGQPQNAATSSAGAVRGSIVGAANEPLRKAEVVLRPVSGRGGGSRVGPFAGSGNTGQIWSHTTDATGAFAFMNVPPGSYALSVQRNGYVRMEYGQRPGSRGEGKPIVVSAGAEVAGIHVKMTPHGVVAGRILDEDGDPVASAQVQVVRQRWQGGRKQVVPAGGASTNDLGEYRISGLTPGTYHVLVNFRRPEPFSRARPTDVLSDLSYAPVFFPGVTEFSQATPITLAPGQEMRGADIQVRKLPTWRVRGRVLDESGKAAAQVSVMAVPTDGALLIGVRSVGVVRGPEGVFEISGLQPGTYTLIANRASRQAGRSVGRQEVQVGNRDVEGVVIALQPAVSISGIVRLPDGVSTGSMRVALDPLDSAVPFGGGAAPVDASGAWTVQGVAPGRYRFYVAQTPEGTYLKRVAVQGQDITDGATISGPAEGIELTLGAKAPEVTGGVINRDKEPVAGAVVIIAPEAAKRGRTWLFRTTTSDDSGAWSLRGLTPGRYTLYAVTGEVEDGIWHSPDFLASLEGRGVALELEEGSMEAVQMTPAL